MLPKKRIPTKVGLLPGWVGPAQANKWPDGVVVLVRRLDRKITAYGGIEIQPYFRPDLIDHEPPSIYFRLTRQRTP